MIMIVDENVKFRFMAGFANHYLLSVFLKGYLGPIPEIKIEKVSSGITHRQMIVKQKDFDEYFGKSKDGDHFKIMINDEYSLYVTYHIDPNAQYKSLYRLYDMDPLPF